MWKGSLSMSSVVSFLINRLKKKRIILFRLDGLEPNKCKQTWLLGFQTLWGANSGVNLSELKQFDDKTEHKNYMFRERVHEYSDLRKTHIWPFIQSPSV